MEQELKLEVEHFYRELESVRFYWMKLKSINLRLEEVAVKLYYAGAIDYSREKIGQGTPYQNNKISLMIKEEKLKDKANIWRGKIDYCRMILSACSNETKYALIHKFVLGKSWERVSDDLNISRPPLLRKVGLEISEILKGTIVP